MATAHLIHGYIGAGKTRFAKRLEAETGGVRFTHDEWMRALHGDDPPEDAFAGHARRICALMEQVWTRCLAAGVDVVLDSGFWSRAERDRVRALVCGIGGEARLYRLSCPDDLAWRRVEARNEALDASLHIAPNTFAVLKARFEPLGADEARIEIAQDAAAR